MKRIWLAVIAAVAGLSVATEARADFGGPPIVPASHNHGAIPEAMGGVPMYNEGVPAPAPAERYGLLPIFKKSWWKKEKDPCANGACGSAKHSHGHGPGVIHGLFAPMGPSAYGAGPYGGPPGVGMPGTPGAGMPGTLVFPNHPYARSPRDYFMWDANTNR